MPISITYWRDVLRKLTTTEMDNNFENIVNAIADAGLSPTMPEGQIYIGDNTNNAILDTLDTSIVPETTDKNYQTDNQKLFNDATSSIQTQIDSKEPTIASGTTSQYWRGDKTWQTFPTISTPTLDEVTDVGNTTTNSIEVGGLVVDMPSGLGVAVEITKGGNGEALTVNKTSGSGNVASFNNGTTLVKDLEVSTATANRPAFFDSSKKLVIATGALLGTWFQTLTAKSTPIGADTIIVNDSASSSEAKTTTLTELWTNYLRAFVFSATLTTNRIVKANASGVLVDSNTVDDGTTITSTLNRVFTGASGSNNGTGANSNKFLFNGANTVATASFVQVAPEMQFNAPGVGSSLRGMLYLDGSANTYANNGFTQLYINSGGDIIGSKISQKEALRIFHRSSDNANNGNNNSSSVVINAVMHRPQISAVSAGSSGVHHITSQNADNYSSIIQAGVSGSNPIHYSAFSQRDNAVGFQHYKTTATSSGILGRHNANLLFSSSTTWSNGFGFSVSNFLGNSNASPQIVDLQEEYIIQNQGAGTVYGGKRYRNVGVNQAAASAYIIGLYPTGVVIGDTTALPNASAQLDVQSTTKGFLPPRMTNAQRTAITSPAIGLMVYCTDATEGLYIYKSTGWTFII
jgi:hypothetical protein